MMTKDGLYFYITCLLTALLIFLMIKMFEHFRF